MRAARWVLIAAATLAATAEAASFVAVGSQPTIVFDAPSQRAEKQFVASRYYPLEVLVRLDQWTKVRDVAGDVGWVENKALGSKRFVLVNVDNAEVRSQPSDTGSVTFTAQKQVVLELLEPTGTAPASNPPATAPGTPAGSAAAPGAAAPATAATPAPAATPPAWVRVQHRDGQSGFVKAAQVWGL